MPPIKYVRESRDHKLTYVTRTRARLQGFYRESWPATKDDRVPRGIPTTRPNVGVVSDDRRDKLRIDRTASFLAVG